VLACITSAPTLTPEVIMKIKELPPVELLKELFDYDPLTGLLRWKKKLSPRSMPGAVAGTERKTGYIIISLNGQKYYAHRICWAIYYNEQLDPGVEIDHKYGNRNDNRISELRKSTRSEQAYNTKLLNNNRSGHRGVFWNKYDERWAAKITVQGKQIRLGGFKTKEEAIEARLKAEKDLNIFVGERTEVR
jgi:hypothetical protein